MKIFLTLSIFISFFVKADDINNYRYYQINHSEKYIAYIKRNDPCIYGGRVKENDIHKYCEMADTVFFKTVVA
ncbi:hypothetical protein A8139_02265 [Marinomonas primoryensis]|uniref:Uncharacterized protein n=1 Tax=Marinomonas primoryensis TaxID=178399 RepID=A0A2Z4PMY6_9GAMM|nr:hypothetical protein A8139_02265 [Marinomonas primoryensis]